MKVETDTNEVVNSWRAVIKNKRRMVYTFGERADIRLSAIKGQIYQRRIPLNTWEIRECYHRGADRYEYLGDWRPISVGERWGGTDVTAFFKRQIAIPAEFAGETVALRFYISGESSAKFYTARPTSSASWASTRRLAGSRTSSA